jgi:aldehyde:ferredoxin oxidoreductase
MLNFSFFDTRRKVVKAKQAGRAASGPCCATKRSRPVLPTAKRVTGNRNNVVDLQAINGKGQDL